MDNQYNNTDEFVNRLLNPDAKAYEPRRAPIQSLFDAVDRFNLSLARGQYTVQACKAAYNRLKQDLNALGVEHKFDFPVYKREE